MNESAKGLHCIPGVHNDNTHFPLKPYVVLCHFLGFNLGEEVQEQASCSVYTYLVYIT